jgi:hypothetical protein
VEGGDKVTVPPPPWEALGVILPVVPLLLIPTTSIVTTTIDNVEVGTVIHGVDPEDKIHEDVGTEEEKIATITTTT